MSSKPQETPDGFHNRLTDTDQWCEDHQIHEQFIPFHLRPYDPIEILQAIRETIEETEDTAKTINTKRADDRVDANLRHLISEVRPLFWVCGTWPIPDEFSRSKFVNPNYIHLDSLDGPYIIQESTERNEFIRATARFGCIEMQDIAPRLGIGQEAVQMRVYRNDIPWLEMKTEGIRRLSRTMAVLDDWGYSRYELADAFGYARSSVDEMIRQHDPDSFTAPDDPTA